MMPKSGGGQNTADPGSKIDALLKRFTRIAVDVGQHTGETAQTGRDHADRWRKAEMIGDPSDGNARGGTASDVLLEITHKNTE